MSTYGLRLVNTSKSPQDFYFFTAPPDFGKKVTTVYTNTWVKRTADPGEPIDITTELDFYAWCGPGVTQVGKKTTVKQGVSSKRPVTLGVAPNSDGSTYMTKFDPNRQHIGWGDSHTSDADPGCYSIITDDFSKAAVTPLIGMAMDSQDGGPIPTPVAMIPAGEGGDTFNIAPIVKFYVAEGDSETGELIDYKKVSTIAGCYDFSPTGDGAGMFYGVINYLPGGKWSAPKYLPIIPPISLETASGNGWLQAIVDFALPIITGPLKNAIINAITQQLTQLHYAVGPVTFSSNGTTLSVSYKFFDQAQVSSQIGYAKPYSEVWISVDAKNEILQVKFTPRMLEDYSSPKLIEGGNPVADVIDKAIRGVSGLPSGEKWTIRG